MERTLIPAVGSRIPASAAAKVGNILFVTGQVGRDPATGVIAEGMKAQTRQCLQNLAAILAQADTSMEQVLKTTVFITDMSKFEDMNAVYREFWAPGNYPARSTVEVKGLAHPSMLVEIEAVAHA